MMCLTSRLAIGAEQRRNESVGQDEWSNPPFCPDEVNVPDAGWSSSVPSHRQMST